MQYQLQLEVFEGPFDLLIHLIDKQELNIYDIPISQITEQYIDYIKQMQHANLEVMSEFIVMAAHLLEIKSKMLLPKTKEKNDDVVVDPRQELVDKLIEYKAIKQITEYFKDREIIGEKLLCKVPEPVEKFLVMNDFEDENVLGALDLSGLFMAFQKVIERSESRIDKIRSSFRTIKKDTHTVEDQMKFVLSILEIEKRVKFFELFESTENKLEIVVTFLAILELIKTKKIRVVQEEAFQEIEILYVEGEENATETNSSGD